MENLGKSPANYVPLTPLSFLDRAADVYADRPSIIYGDIRFSWAETRKRCRRLAFSLLSYVAKGEVVSVLAPNVPALYEMHFAVPMAGAVLNTINTRLDARAIATILSHSQAKLLFVDYELLSLAKVALTMVKNKLPGMVLIHDDPCHADSELMTYEDLVQGGDPEFSPLMPADEWDSIALNYTSGTTSAPKGVVYSHRGVYLSSLAILLLWEMGMEPVYLWTLPMFHCNGWTFTWALAARGGTNVCIRNISAKEIFSAITRHGVTHLCCAPIVFNIILNAEPHERAPFAQRLHILTGGAPPPPTVVSTMEAMGFHVTHAYGLTEATGPALACDWKREWDGLSVAERGALKGRQGVGVLSLDGVDVKDPETMSSVARDGKSVGEIMLRGSSLMKGYLHDQCSTAEAFAGGWFHTGDMGVVHPDGYVEIKDRSKDVIISGGENISSVEVESVLYSHPHVTEAAVVAMPHPHWGETPCAFINSKHKIKEDDVISFCRENLPRYMVPKAVVFMEELPKTSTGKIQKFILREMAKKLSPPSPSPSLSTPSPKTVKKGISKEPHKSVSDHYVVARSRL